ncbi:NAD(P)/FAD-dependent oxidoreductase [Alkalibacter rhizosphaerae]|uniref:NAD(P)/FAD-dependent oxidoreductase n=1 Tax=Alkalibacter rhizosphaerae TaxID=2815577 RepID=A0A974XDQ8_9FIRM|nr:NAD(P)/FAD-dependent oxidoreductase [Alkalibacter rhizosphaerae]QSX07962.1 NAD(P)/FAD-dependent oxidoreductase [Alkalibacter rhizosphaerae]
MYDVLIIGAGVVGCAVARELSRFDLSVGVLEKDSDVSNGTSKANSGIVHGGYDGEPGTLKARLGVDGNAMFKELDKDLQFGFNKCGSYVLAFDENDHEELKKLYEKGMKNNTRNISLVGRDFVLANEPNVNPNIHSALYCGSAGIISPFEFTIALAENAGDNGVEFHLETPVTAIKKGGSGYLVYSGNQVFQTRFVVNAAGLYSDVIAGMAGAGSFKITPRKGEYLLFDKEVGGTVGSVLFQTPKKDSKGILVTPTIHGNLMIGPNAQHVDDKESLLTTREGLQEVATQARRTVPKLDMSKVITQYAGLRSSLETYDFIMEETLTGFINLVGIDSPGLTSSPAMAKEVVGMLDDAGLAMKEKKNYISYRAPYIRMDRMSNEEINELIVQDRRFGKIVCRCESISEGEIVDVLHRSIPVRSIDGIKRRARVTSGRCQGGFCTPRVMEIMTRELDLDMLEITKNNKGSNILTGITKKGLGGMKK